MGSYTPPLWGSSNYINCLELFCMGNLSSLLHLFIWSFIYISMSHGYVFYTLGYNLVSLYLFCCSYCFRSSLVGSCVPLTYSHYCGFLPFLSTSLLSGSTVCSRLILFMSCSSPQISRCSFHWRMILETKICMLGVSFTTGVSLLPGPLSWQSKEMWLCILISVYTHL